MTLATYMPPPSKAAVDQTYEDVKRWITTIVSDFKRHYNDPTDHDDLFQEACLAYLHALPRWIPGRSSFLNFLRVCVWTRLFSALRTRRYGCKSESVNHEYIEDLDPPCSDRMHAATGDAHVLLNIVYSAPGVNSEHSLWKYASQNLGWDEERFCRAYNLASDEALP